VCLRFWAKAGRSPDRHQRETQLHRFGAETRSLSSDSLAFAKTAPADAFRARLDQENLLAVQRVSWLLVSQSFLFIAYTAVVIAKPAPNRHEQAVRLYHTIPVLGLVIVAGVYISIIAALVSIRELRREFDLLEAQHRNPFDAIPNRSVRALGAVAVHVPPVAIGATWIWLLVAGH